ncbi:Hypothetical protein CINCED_3A009429 [Cinara cedri]|nr:Hypothetical protein CINCED_3A009429 [Cinara cedri]
METLIDSASQKTINYGYTSSVIAADDEFINATAAAPPHRRQHQKQQEQQQKQQRPMLPPPASATSQDPSPANDVYDCCVSLDGIPVRHEFQYTLSDADGCGTVTKHDIEGLASKILESVYETTLKFSSRGQRTVKVTLNVRQTASPQPVAGAAPVKQLQRIVGGRGSFKQNYYGRTSVDRTLPQYVGGGGELQPAARCPIYGVVKGGSSSHHIRTKYRREQLIEMVQRSLAENLSFQNQR